MLSTVRSRIATVLIAIAVISGAIFAATYASAADVTPQRGWCVKSGTGELRNLWFDPNTGKCPSPYWGPVSLGNGAAGPQGPKGDPGDSRLVITSGSASTAAGAAGNGTVIVSVPGMPGFSATQARRVFVDLNSEMNAEGVMMEVGRPTANPGATSWNFPVTVAGQTAATPPQRIRLDVLAVPVN